MPTNPTSTIPDLQTIIFDAISDAVYLTDRSGDFTLVARNVDVIFGYSQQEVQAFKNVLNLIPNLDRSILATTEEIKNIELELTAKDGSTKTVLVTVKPVDIHQGVLLFSLRDITERKLVEQELLEQRDRFRMISENIQEVLYLYDPAQDRFLYISPSYEEIWQQPLSQVYDDPLSFTYLIHPDDRAAFQEAVLKEHQDGEYFNLEYRIVRPDGSVRWVWSRNFPTKYDKDQKQLTVGVAEDITERKNAEEALVDNEERYKALYDNAPLAYQSLDENGHFIDVNPTWLKMLGYSRDEVIGEYFGGFLHPDWKPHFEKNFAAFKKRGYVHNVCFKIRHSEGRYLDISFEGCIGYHPDGSFKQTYCVFQDITERLKAEESLRESEALLKKIAENYPNSFLSIIEKDFSVGYTAGQEFARQNLDPEQFIGLSLEQVFGEHTETVRAHYEKTFQGEEQSFELFINNQYQHYRTVPLTAQDGSVPRILSVVENITERKQAEIALKEAHDTLEARVKERTAKLQIMVNSMVGRENRMVELKDVIRKLRRQLIDLGVEPVADDPILSPKDN